MAYAIVTGQKECRAMNLARNECGAAMIETALSATVLLGLFFGVMQMSLALYTYHFISEAAREATRYAMVRGSSCSGFASACPATAANVRSFVGGLNFPGIVPANITVTTTWPTTGSTCAPSSSPCNNPGNLVKVNVQYKFPLSIPFVTSTHLTLTSTSQMTISQ